MEKGRFITIEGIEGVGKSTHISFIANTLRGKGVPVLTTREPGGTPLAARIRELVVNKSEDPPSIQAELLLIFAARAEHVIKVIQPALARGEWVISDRFTDSTYVYQGQGRGVPKALISKLENFVQGALRPDWTVLFDLDPRIALERAALRGKRDRFEEEGIIFFRRLRASYLRRARSFPQRFRIVDANRPLESIQNDLKTILDTFLIEKSLN
ncbi:MAG: dTMP kinase [Gammaproteobacteria bacterium]|nr:dTMP kinase [Gammaproteobacteria bacterium]